MQIHSVISIAQLKSSSHLSENFYKQNINAEPSSIINKDNDELFYKIEHLMNWCTTKCERTQYLVKWKSYHHNHDV